MSKEEEEANRVRCGGGVEEAGKRLRAGHTSAG